ncbi:hypothetical protein TSMEX_010798 [Taenia solium]|eukprot:TsM_000564700 transcript=TsM_000564700 gene=TsM_000564700
MLDSVPDPLPPPLTCDSKPCANHAQCMPLVKPTFNGQFFRCLCDTALGNFAGQSIISGHDTRVYFLRFLMCDNSGPTLFNL